MFERPKIPSHKELDKRWAKLTKEIKHYALQEANRMMERIRQQDEWRAKVKEAEKGKRVGEECTCLPELKNCCYVDQMCSYCQYQHHQDWINSPG